MRSVCRELGFALLAWLIPFGMSVLIFPLKHSDSPLFESLMGVTLVGSTAALGCVYLRRYRRGFVFVAVRMGLNWMVANWLLDALMFSSGPMKMSLHQYLNEIAGAYFMIPAITSGLGAAAAQATRRPTPDSQSVST